MGPEQFIRVLAGSVILITVGLAHYHSQWWLLATCFVGLNLIQSAITGFCPPTIIGRKLGFWRDTGCCRSGGGCCGDGACDDTTKG
jgi:hypothetical protein